MSGHSKWANIKRKKEANDKVRGSMFSKLSRLITLSVLEGGGMTDPDFNIKLRLAVEKAKQFNMPKDNIKRAIERGTGPDRQNLKEVVYEAFAPHGVALIIQVTTDNINRTLSEVRNILDRNGGKMGSQGSVSYLFQKCGLITFAKKDVSEEDVLMSAQELEAMDIDQDEAHFFVYLPFENLGKVKDCLVNLKYESTELDYRPLSLIQLNSEEEVKKITSLIEAVEELDDVQRVFANFDISNEQLKALEG